MEFWVYSGKKLMLIVFLAFVVGLLIRLDMIGEVRAWSQTIRGVVSQAGTTPGTTPGGGSGTSGANLSTGGSR